MRFNPKPLLLFLLSSILLFLNFDRNLLRLVPASTFANFDTGSESLVVGRLVWIGQKGFFADGALLGTGDASSPILGEAEFEQQYKTYLAGGNFQTYTLYKSQSGGQAWFFAALDSISPFAPSTNLRLYRALTALLTALTLAALILWFYSQFGLVPALAVLLSSLLSQWLTISGRNLFYSIWDYFLPMVAALYLLERERRGIELRRSFYLIVGFLIFIKGFLSGYDFLLPPMGMVATALFYYAIKDKWGFWKFARRLLWTGLACALGVIASFLVLAAQIGATTGHFSDGLLHIVNTMGRRTFGTPLDPSQSEFFAQGQHANLFAVIETVTRKTALVRGIQFPEVFLVFAAATLLALLILFIRRAQLGDTSAARALVVTTWVSFLSPLSWLVVFKAHAYYHPFTTPIVWHMPVTFFGYALCGLSLALLFRRAPKDTAT